MLTHSERDETVHVHVVCVNGYVISPVDSLHKVKPASSAEE